MPDFSDQAPPNYDPVADRTFHRLTAIYSVDRQATVATEFATDYASEGTPIGNHLRLDRLAPCYEAASRQFPRVLQRTDLTADRITLGVQHCMSMVGGRIWFVAFPHGSAAVAITLEMSGDVFDCIPVRLSRKCAETLASAVPRNRRKGRIGGCYAPAGAKPLR